jgi:hypothetical protein
MPDSPTLKQLRLLRTLALERGRTFAVPATRAQASGEIARLKTQRRSTRIERTLERRQISRDLANSGDAAAVTRREIVGHGSTARWAGQAGEVR